jgi:hypothetical protein
LRVVRGSRANGRQPRTGHYVPDDGEIAARGARERHTIVMASSGSHDELPPSLGVNMKAPRWWGRGKLVVMESPELGENFGPLPTQATTRAAACAATQPNDGRARRYQSAASRRVHRRPLRRRTAMLVWVRTSRRRASGRRWRRPDEDRSSCRSRVLRSLRTETDIWCPRSTRWLGSGRITWNHFQAQGSGTPVARSGTAENSGRHR